MNVFISYDLDDKHKFDELAEVFGQRGIPFFDPRAMVGGRSLAVQLREAIANSTVCVFVATHNSVDSAWCAAELGAFWGAGKDVVLYVADAALKDEKLPKQFAGWLLVRNLFKVANDIQALDKDAKSEPSIPKLSTLNVEDFKTLLIKVLQDEKDSSELGDLIFQLGGEFDHDYDEERFKRVAGRGLRNLLGETLPKPLEMKVRGWRYAFDAPTTTGIWIGYGQVSQHEAQDMLQLYKNCLLLLLDEQRKIIAAALTHSVALAHRALGLSSWTRDENVIAHAGCIGLGVAISEE